MARRAAAMDGGCKKNAGQGPAQGGVRHRSEIVGDGEAHAARRMGVLYAAVVRIGAAGGTEEVVVEDRRLVVQHIEHGEVEIEFLLRPLRLVVNAEIDVVHPRRGAERTGWNGYAAAPVIST